MLIKKHMSPSENKNTLRFAHHVTHHDLMLETENNFGYTYDKIS